MNTQQQILSLSRSIYAKATNRELLKDYRTTVKLVAELEEHHKQGRKFYLGDNTQVRILQEKRELSIIKEELVKRGYVVDKIKV